MAAKVILMNLGDFVEDREAVVPLQVLTMVGHEVHTACPNRKVGPFPNAAVGGPMRIGVS